MRRCSATRTPASRGRRRARWRACSERAGSSRRRDAFPYEAEPPDASGAGARVLVLDSRPGRGARQVSAAISAIVGRRAAAALDHHRLLRSAPARVPAPRPGGRAAASTCACCFPAGPTSRSSATRATGSSPCSWRAVCGSSSTSPAILHAKTIVADGYVSVIGSSNLDFRSFERNAECNFAILDGDGRRRHGAAFRGGPRERDGDPSAGLAPPVLAASGGRRLGSPARAPSLSRRGAEGRMNDRRAARPWRTISFCSEAMHEIPVRDDRRSRGRSGWARPPSSASGLFNVAASVPPGALENAGRAVCARPVGRPPRAEVVEPAPGRRRRRCAAGWRTTARCASPATAPRAWTRPRPGTASILRRPT